MSDALSAIARRVVAFAGLDPPGWVLEARARERADRAGVDLDGYPALLDDEDELRALAEALRVGETRFFRHRAHIAALRRTVLPERARAALRARSGITCSISPSIHPDRPTSRPSASPSFGGAPGSSVTCREQAPSSRLAGSGASTAENDDIISAGRLTDGRREPLLRAWSAGCATGEEAWSLAALCAEAVGDEGFEVLATDLSAPALAASRAGRYPRRALDGAPPELRARFFVGDGETVEPAPALRAHVRFEQRNLLEGPYPRRLDLILCRNVLIYFEPARRAAVVERLAASLVEGGYLFLGYAETLRERGDLFESLRDESGAVIFRRRTPHAGGTGDPETRDAYLPSSPRLPRRPIDPAAGEERNSRPPRRSKTSAATESAAGERTAIPSVGDSTTSVVRLSGEYGPDDLDRLTRELTPLVSGAAHRLDLDGATFLGAEAARVLARVAEAAHGRITVRARREPVRRWLAAHGLGARFALDEERDG